jgi:hypothetical protein
MRLPLEDGRLMFERTLGCANHPGLYAEETGHSGEALGNFCASVHTPRAQQRRF